MMHRRRATLPFDQQDALIVFTQYPEHNRKLKNYLEQLTEDACKNILKNHQQLQDSV